MGWGEGTACCQINNRVFRNILYIYSFCIASLAPRALPRLLPSPSLILCYPAMPRLNEQIMVKYLQFGWDIWMEGISLASVAAK